MSHPDKSHLDKKYFLFFSSAFKLVYSIYQYRKKSQTDDITKVLKELTEANVLGYSTKLGYSIHSTAAQI